MAAIDSGRKYVPPKNWAGTDENSARIYLDSDDDARLDGELPEEVDRGLVFVAQLVLMAVITAVILATAAVLMWLAPETTGMLP